VFLGELEIDCLARSHVQFTCSKQAPFIESFGFYIFARRKAVINMENNNKELFIIIFSIKTDLKDLVKTVFFGVGI